MMRKIKNVFARGILTVWFTIKMMYCVHVWHYTIPEYMLKYGHLYGYPTFDIKLASSKADKTRAYKIALNSVYGVYGLSSAKFMKKQLSNETRADLQNYIMNTPNSTFSKMDVIVQLPYNLRSQRMQDMVKKRSEELENQLRDSKYGIVWAGVSDKIIQLNRSPSNQLLESKHYKPE